MKRKPLVIALAAVVTSLAVIAGSLWWSARPVGTPVAVEWSDAVPSDRLTAATVLALGEATHGTAEFHSARLDLLKKVAGKGFTTIAFEDDFGHTAAVDAWLQGGPGTADEAAAQFGYGIHRTTQMRDLLAWARAWNEERPAEQHIRIVGIDAGGPERTKAMALAWLATRNPDAARSLGERLSRLNDGALFDQEVAQATEAASADLQAALAASDDGSPAAAQAIQAGRVVEQSRNRAFEGVMARDPLLFDNLTWVVERGAAEGRRHTLLFAHNGHVDRSGQANGAPGQKLGRLAADHFGDAYRTIGTDGHRVSLGSQGETFSFTVNAPYRGLFAGTTVGYLEMAAARGDNAAVLRGSHPMASAGAPFAAWQALLPMAHSLNVVPAQAWDAVIYVWDAHPATPLP